MPFVVKNQKGEYLKGRANWDKSFVSDISKARVFLNRSNASNSIRETRTSYRYKSSPDLSIVEVAIVEVSQ